MEGLDYEAIYILDSSIFGHGDFGRLTFTLNGTYLSRFEFQATPVSKRIGLSGEFVSRTDVYRLVAAQSSLCQRILRRPGWHVARRLRYWRDRPLHRPV